MQKEVILAIVFGSLLGIVVAFGIYKANSSFKEQAEVQEQIAEKTSSATIQNSDQSSLVLARPADYSVLVTDTTEVEGIAKNDSYIVLINAGDITLSKTQANGGFKMEADLNAGINNLAFYSLAPNSPQQKNNLTLIYTTKLSDDETDSNASQSANLDDKVNEKLQKAANFPTAFIGTITDITEGSLQIKAENDQIRQISTTDNTSYVNIIKTSKDITVNELAIGDYVAALGYKSENDILSAKRIIVTTQSTSPQYSVQLGNVTEISSTKIEVNAGNQINTYNITKSTILRQFNNDDNSLIKIKTNTFEEEDMVMLVTQETQGESTLHSIIRL